MKDAISILILINLLVILFIYFAIYLKNTFFLERFFGILLLSNIQSKVVENKDIQNNTEKPDTAPQYERSHLRNVDVDKLSVDLRTAMKTDRVYRDNTISLKSLAEHLDITLHQLSEYLNKYHKKNFNTFVAEYRVEDAKELLVKYDWRTTLSIAFEVGFNSNSSFNRCFKLLTGKSPGQYRNEQLP